MFCSFARAASSIPCGNRQMEGRRRGNDALLICQNEILAVKRGFHSFPHFLGNFEQFVLFVRSFCLEF